MIKPDISSSCNSAGELELICPNCSSKRLMPVFDADTAVKLGFVKLRTLHTKRFAVCTDCKCSFEVDR